MTISVFILAIFGYFIAIDEWQKHQAYRKLKPKSKKGQPSIVDVDDIDSPGGISPFTQIVIDDLLDAGKKVVLSDGKGNYKELPLRVKGSKS